MTNTSFAAEAVANGPQTLAPPSFDGHGWLVVINLVMMTAGFIIAASLAANMLNDIVRSRRQDKWRHPVTIWRAIGMFLGTGMAIRFGAAATVLWGWNPDDPAATGWLLTAQRFTDPIAAVFGISAMTIFKLSGQSMADKLRRLPLPVKLWASREELKRPAAIALLSLIAAIGVVSTR